MKNFLLKTGRALALGTALWLGTGHVQAQVSAYTYAASTGAFTPLPASATDVSSVLGDDVVSSALPLNFNFTYDGAGFTNVLASSNGFVSFNPTSGSNLSNSLSTTGAEKPLVAPFWDDLDGRDPSARASYQTTGTAPNRVFTFEWLNWFRYGNTGGPSFSMQVKLYETTNVVEFVYRREAGSVTGATASVGLSGDASGGTPDFLSLNNTTATATASSTTETSTIADVPATGQIYRFTPPVVTGCPAPRSIAATNVTGNSATVSFRGTATSYTVTYQAAGGPVQTVSPNPNSSPVALSGLLRSTTYTVTVVANCAGGVTSAAATGTFTTSNGYCATGLGGFCGGNDISDVVVGGSGLNATGLTCTATGGDAYTNYPASGSTTGTLLRGNTYQISVTTTGNSIISAWLDTNNNLSFEPNEWVQVATSSVAGTPDVVSIQVPLSAPLGLTGLRIRSRANGNINGAVDACTGFGSGETKDFTVTIGATPACPAPSNLTATNLTTTGATLSFATAGSGTYTLVYGPAGFNPSTGGTTIPNVTSPVTLTTLTAGTTYEFYVQQNCGAAGLSQQSGPVRFSTRITNDEACTATPLTINNTCVPLVVSSTAATASTTSGLNNTGCFGFGATPVRDVWFSFTTAATGPTSTAVRITVTGAPAGSLQVYSGACAGPLTYLACTGSQAGTAAPVLSMSTLTPNTTYYVRVSPYISSDALGSFTICASPVPNCPAPAGLGTGTLTNTTSQVSWTAAPSAGATFTVIYGPTGFSPATGGTTITGISGTSTTLTNLSPSTNYQFYVQQVCGGFNGSSTLAGPYSFTTPLTAPTNDEPCGATPLGATTNDSNVGSTTSLQNGINLPACSPAQAPKDVWFSFTPTGTSVTMTFTGNPAAMVRVFISPDCANGPFNQVACRAGAGNNQSVGTVNLTGLIAGQRYYLAVSGFGSSDTPGNFTIATTGIVLGARARVNTDALLVYPNPSSTGQLTLRLAAAGTVRHATLLNTLGQVVLERNLAASATEHSLTTRGLAAGVYTLRVVQNGETLTRKVVLE